MRNWTVAEVIVSDVSPFGNTQGFNYVVPIPSLLTRLHEK